MRGDGNRQAALMVENLGQMTGMIRTLMLKHDDRRREVLRKAAEDDSQCLQSALRAGQSDDRELGFCPGRNDRLFTHLMDDAPELG